MRADGPDCSIVLTSYTALTGLYHLKGLSILLFFTDDSEGLGSIAFVLGDDFKAFRVLLF